MKTQVKIVLVLLLSTILILLLFSAGVFYFVNKYSYVDFYKRLETRARIAAQYYLEEDRLSAETYKAISRQHLEKLSQEKEYLIDISDRKAIISGALKYRLPQEYLSEIDALGKSQLQRGNTFYSGIKYTNDQKTYLAIVSADNYFSSHHLSFLRNILLTGILVTLLISVWVFIYFSRHIFDPIREITRKVKEISTGKIYLRLQENENSPEIRELVSTFNDLLNRIETSLETQKNFVSNASHELGTPLTAIIGEADVALMKTRSAEEYQESLQSIIEQAERLYQITKSLIFLAETGYRADQIPFEILRTDEIVWSVKGIIDTLNPQNKITVDLNLLPEDPKKLKIMGNKQLLYLALSNVLNNACKYSQNKAVNISIASSDNKVIIIVRDLGIGIPESEMQYIYDPFFRASNTHMYEGYGIGLPLTRNIVRLHNGSILVTSKPGEGTAVQIKFPLHHV